MFEFSSSRITSSLLLLLRRLRSVSLPDLDAVLKIRLSLSPLHQKMIGENFHLYRESSVALFGLKTLQRLADSLITSFQLQYPSELSR